MVEKIKIASPKNSQKVFSSLFSENEVFNKQVKELVWKEAGKYQSEYQGYYQGFKDLVSGKSSRKAYDAFNVLLVGNGDLYDAPKRSFFDALRKAGYSGLVDVTDQSYSGYNAKSPVIIFDTKKVIQDSIHQLTADEVSDYYKKAMKLQNLDTAIKTAPLASLGYAWFDSVQKDRKPKSGKR